MRKFRLTIGRKILGGFLTLIIIFALNASMSIVTLNNNASMIQDSSENIKPSLDALKQFTLLVSNSKMYATNWVYIQTGNADKEALKELHNIEYPRLKAEITDLMQLWKNENEKKMMDTIFTDFEKLLEVQDRVMKLLVTFDDYNDAMIKFEAQEAIESEIFPMTTELLEILNRIDEIKTEATRKSEESIMSSFQTLRQTILILGIVVISLGFIGAFITARSITKPVKFIKDIIQKLGKGELPEESNKKFTSDEIGEMAMAVDNLVTGLKSTSYFAENIGNGNYQAEFQPLSEKDVLGNALINMRDNLSKVAEDDKKRNWATEGLAKFGEILRKNNDNIARLSDEIITNLVKYLKANQGGLFILNNEDDAEPYLELSACYAWDKKKYIEQKIYKGEGLTGQSWQEKDTIYITDVPEDYINITSGLGQANPKCILIVPLKVNDEIFGVIEIASFTLFKDFEKEFVEKIAESIASTISSVKINEKTQRLLHESTELTEQMRSQEEEMRQNMEELQATQEEMQRAQKDREDKESIINSTNMMFELDHKFNISFMNQMVKDVLHYDYFEINGKPFENYTLNKEEFKNAKENIVEGNSWSGYIKLISKNRKEIMAKASAGAIYDPNEMVNKYLFILTDITKVLSEVEN